MSKEEVKMPEDIQLEILNDEQKKYRFYEDNATATIKELERSLELQYELREFFKTRIKETAD